MHAIFMLDLRYTVTSINMESVIFLNLLSKIIIKNRTDIVLYLYMTKICFCKLNLQKSLTFH